MNHIIIAPLEKSLFSDFSYSKVGILVDENTHQYCYPIVERLLPYEHTVVKIRSGEQYKNIQTCTQIWNYLTDHQFDRNSVLINLGGGVIGDMGGFCASTYKRGIDFIQIPTTLLAQVDASVGGKLGIDFRGFKNHVGLFRNPSRVWIDTQFLQTLPEREVYSGFAEVIKHSLVADVNYWSEIRQKDVLAQNWEAVVRKSIKIKTDIVEQDSKERGIRKILNFGHTIGHAIESAYIESVDHERFLHGEAIAIGMICETFISVQKQLLEHDLLCEIQNYILGIYDKIGIDSNLIPKILQNVWQDKKNTASIIHASLLCDLGKCKFNVSISEQEIRNAIRYYNNLL